MSKRVLVISTTLRKDGNSELLSKEFARGAKDNGNEVEFISLRGKNIEFCRGCLSCQITETCIINDDVKEIISKMKISDVITFSTPIYYYEMSGQLKTLLDRANPLFQSKYNFKDIYLITTAADTNPNADKTAINGIESWISCFKNVNLKGTLLGSGVLNAREIIHNPSMKKAYEMGFNV